MAEAERDAFEYAYTKNPDLIYEAFPQEIEPSEETSFVAAMLDGKDAEAGRIFRTVCRRYILRDTDLVERFLHPKRENQL